MKSLAAPQQISDAFLEARALCLPLRAFPGELPSSLQEAYAIQAQSIKRWSREIVGWKVGGVPPALQDKLSATRLAGPVFEPTLRYAKTHSHTNMPAFSGGFAAVEAEFILQLGDTSAFPERAPTADDVVEIVDAVYMGIEIASSPLRTINEIGPLAVVCDFGNNHGILVGPSIGLDLLPKLNEISVSVEINGKTAGKACCPHGLDGPLGAVAFLIHQLRSLGHPIPIGTLVTTGAITGVHDTQVGADSVVTFEGVGTLNISLVEARPL